MTTPLKVLIFAGPNGAGKSTFASTRLANEPEDISFINADLIAAKLCPENPAKAAVEAGRLMIGELETHFVCRRNFALETTLSGRGYLRLISRWRSVGYKVELLFLKLESADQAVLRVKQRVAQGGHDIPEDVICRRFTAGCTNFLNLYAPIVDEWELYNNSGPVPVLLDWGAKP